MGRHRDRRGIPCDRARAEYGRSSDVIRACSLVGRTAEEESLAYGAPVTRTRVSDHGAGKLPGRVLRARQRDTVRTLGRMESADAAVVVWRELMDAWHEPSARALLDSLGLPFVSSGGRVSREEFLRIARRESARALGL